MGSSRTTKLLITATIAVIAALAVFAYVKLMRSPASFDTDYADGRRAYLAGSPSSSIPAFESAVANATNPSQKGAATLNLGTATLYADTARGVAILKAVAADTRYGDSVRADAIVQILQHWDLHQRDRAGAIEFARTVIFTGDPWGGFLVPPTNAPTLADIRAAEERALEWAAGIYPLVAGEYTIAKHASEDALAATSTAARQEAVARTEEHLQRGTIAMAQTHSTASQIAIAYIYQGQALENLDAGGVAQAAQAIEDAFQHALATSFANPDSKPAQYFSRFARFRIASWQARRGADTAAVQQVLEPVVTTPPDQRTGQLFRLLVSLRSTDTPAGYRGDAVRLAALDPMFKRLLVTLGWTDQILQ